VQQLPGLPPSVGDSAGAPLPACSLGRVVQQVPGLPPSVGDSAGVTPPAWKGDAATTGCPPAWETAPESPPQLGRAKQHLPPPLLAWETAWVSPPQRGRAKQQALPPPLPAWETAGGVAPPAWESEGTSAPGAVPSVGDSGVWGGSHLSAGEQRDAASSGSLVGSLHALKRL
jgi:hypothetical protein